MLPAGAQLFFLGLKFPGVLDRHGQKTVVLEGKRHLRAKSSPG